MCALRAAKKELRQKIKHAIADITRESVNSQTAVATKALFALPQYQSARRISVYLSMPTGEISTAAIVHDALKSGKEVYVPYYYKKNIPREGEPASIMDMLQLHSPQDYEDLRSDKWGIPTPGEDSIPHRRNTFGSFGKSEGGIGNVSEGLDLVILPGMAFDRHLGRLGHGKGFYDYFLQRTAQQSDSSQRKMPFLVGLALQEQVLPGGEEVPMDSTDWRVDAVIVGDGSVVRGP